MNENEDPIRLFLLSALADGKSKAPQELAQAFHATRAKPSDPPNAWRRYLIAVRQQALSLSRTGELEFIRKGVPVNPEKVKGIVRLRLSTGEPRDWAAEEAAAELEGDED